VSGGGSADCAGIRAEGMRQHRHKAYPPRWATRSSTLLAIALRVARCCIDPRISDAACWPDGNTSAKVAPMRIASFAYRRPLDEITVHASQSLGQVSSGPISRSADQPIKIKGTRTMVTQQICRQSNAAKAARSRGVAFVGFARSCETLSQTAESERRCRLWAGWPLMVTARSAVAKRQNCA
jgi:hypothetical protein